MLEERDDVRVRIVLDDSPEQPYDCSSSPILRIEKIGYGSVRAVFVDTGEMRPHQEDEYVINAVQHWETTPSDRDWHLMEKYLRAFFGVTIIETYWSESFWYVTYNSKAWRKSIGFDGVIAPEDDDDPAKPSLEEYQAWCEGECYGYVVEKKVTWRKVDPTTDDPDYLDEMHTWETVDSCWGFYGDEYVKEAAREAFTLEAGESV